MSPRYRKTLVLVVLVAALFGAGFYLREWLGIGLSPEDLSPSKIRENLLALGPAFPLACVALVAFRSFMGIPSGAALLLIGLVAGTSRGILYGSLGLIVSGSFIFTLARMAGREAVEARTPKRFRHVLELAGQPRGGRCALERSSAALVSPPSPGRRRVMRRGRGIRAGQLRS